MLTPEQTAIVEAKLAAHNAANPSDKYTFDGLVAEVGLQTVREWQSQAITQKGLDMVAAAKEHLTEASRIKFTDEVQALLTSYINAK